MALRSRRPGSLHSLAAPLAIVGMASVSLLWPGRAVGPGGPVDAMGATGAVTLDPASLLVRADLRAATEPLTGTRRLLTFAQLSDIHIIDEGSPLRTEFLDPWMGTAYRPQEGMTAQVLERMTGAVRAARSPLTGQAPQLVITTGDNTDTGQRNEVRWFIDVLDGGVIDPDSGQPGTCDLDVGGPRSVSWPGDGRGYDPDRLPSLAVAGTAPVPAVIADGPGYAADASLNLQTIGRSSALPDHPGLRAAMNRPFVAGGLGMPWYASFGNHDALVQGNAPLDPGMAALASGCTKVLSLPDAVLREAAATGSRDGMLSVAFTSMSSLARASSDTSLTHRVLADAARIPLSKRAFIQEHFRTSGAPIGHGFGEANQRTGAGYYAVEAAPGVRLLALDTVNEAGGHQGNIDAEQFAWLHAQLLEADLAGDVVIAFGHHSLASMVQAAPGVHLGGSDGARPAACAQTRPDDPILPDEPVRCLLLRHPSLVALVDGHEHRNRILAHRPQDADSGGGFWEITTASHIEWPQEARLIELVEVDGGLAIVTSMVEHSELLAPDAVAALDGTAGLAAVALQLSHGDPQARNGLDGTHDPAGTAADRDTILLLDRPDLAGAAPTAR